MKWVKLSKYCELSGDTEDAVHARRRRHVWNDGQEFKKAPDGSIWINTQAVEAWVQHQDNQASHEASLSAI